MNPVQGKDVLCAVKDCYLAADGIGAEVHDDARREVAGEGLVTLARKDESMQRLTFASM